MEFDVLILNGTVVDGTGQGSFMADVGIVGDTIEAVGNLQGALANKTIDARGKVVCPGFIDVHVHSELALLGGEDRYAPLRMGVTTQLSGPDGFSWAPLGGETLDEMKQYLRVFYTDSMISTTNSMTIDELLAYYRGRIPSNLVLQVPHGPIRLAVTGWQNRAATDAEMRQMGELVGKWMEAGAVAFATGLEYEPMRHADLRELVYLSKIMLEGGGIYVAHQRGYKDQTMQGTMETLLVAERAGIPVHISHFTVDDVADKLLEDAANRGLDVTFDMYPYPAGSSHLLKNLPEHMQLGPPDDVIRRLRDPGVRKSMRTYFEEHFNPHLLRLAALGGCAPNWEGKTIYEVQQETGLSLTDTVCDLLLKTNLQTLVITHWSDHRQQFLERTFKHPLHMVSTDGIYVGERPHPRGFGTFPKVLREYVYERRWLTLEQAIYKMTGFPARRFRIMNRGVLKTGSYADVVVFDPERVTDRATYEKPRSEPIGIDQVLVNGKCIIDFGRIVTHENVGRIIS